MAVDVNDPNYPKQWVRDSKGPRCTAFSDKAERRLTQADIAYLNWKAERAQGRQGEG